jgi:hypothetical protein
MQFLRIPLDRPLIESFLDRIEIDSVGLIRLIGWSRRTGEAIAPVPHIYLDGANVPWLQTYRLSRPDVESAEGITNRQAGVVYEYLIPKSLYGKTARMLSLTVPKLVALEFEVDLSFAEPHYPMLFDSQTVYKRADMYGAGPPNAQVHPDILDIAKKLPGPILDFGCGSGALLSVMNASGFSCRGLELSNSPASVLFPDSLRHLVTFYDGTFPSPVASGSARTVFCSEVLEHIPDYDGALQDMARIATEAVVITVPDSSAITL